MIGPHYQGVVDSEIPRVKQENGGRATCDLRRSEGEAWAGRKRDHPARIPGRFRAAPRCFHA